MKTTFSIILFALLLQTATAQENKASHTNSSSITANSFGQDTDRVYILNSSIASTWSSKLSTEAGLVKILSGDQRIYGLNASARYRLDDKVTLVGVTSVFNGELVPNFSQKFGVEIKIKNGGTISQSTNVLFQKDAESITVLNLGYSKNVGKSLYTIRAYNQITDSSLLTPSLAASYVYAAKNGDVISLFAQRGYQNTLEPNLGIKNNRLYQLGAGFWFSKSITKNWSLLGTFSYAKFSDNKNINFNSTSIKVGFKKTFNPK